MQERALAKTLTLFICKTIIYFLVTLVPCAHSGAHKITWKIQGCGQKGFITTSVKRTENALEITHNYLRNLPMEHFLSFHPYRGHRTTDDYFFTRASVTLPRTNRQVTMLRIGEQRYLLDINLLKFLITALKHREGSINHVMPTTAPAPLGEAGLLLLPVSLLPISEFHLGSQAVSSVHFYSATCVYANLTVTSPTGETVVYGVILQQAADLGYDVIVSFATVSVSNIAAIIHQASVPISDENNVPSGPLSISAFYPAPLMQDITGIELGMGEGNTAEEVNEMISQVAIKQLFTLVAWICYYFCNGNHKPRKNL